MATTSVSDKSQADTRTLGANASSIADMLKLVETVMKQAGSMQGWEVSLPEDYCSASAELSNPTDRDSFNEARKTVTDYFAREMESLVGKIPDDERYDTIRPVAGMAKWLSGKTLTVDPTGDSVDHSIRGPTKVLQSLLNPTETEVLENQFKFLKMRKVRAIFDLSNIPSQMQESSNKSTEPVAGECYNPLHDVQLEGLLIDNEKLRASSNECLSKHTKLSGSAGSTEGSTIWSKARLAAVVTHMALGTLAMHSLGKAWWSSGSFES